MWIALSLAAALANASYSLVLKKSVHYADVVLSTVVFRFLSGFLLLALTLSLAPWPEPTRAYFEALAMVLPPEALGMLFMALALRTGDLSIVQPILGVTPVFVTLGAMTVLGEVPSPSAGIGIVLVALGVYSVGLEPGTSWLEPLRAFARARASWCALAAAVFWSVTTIIHKFGIAEVGPLPWAVSVTLGSAVLLGAALPLMRRGETIGREPGRTGRWAALMAAAGFLFAVHVFGIHTSLQQAPAGYVIAVSSTATLIATGFGIVILGERDRMRHRLTGALLVTTGAVLVAVLG
jgi:drug/metabolite transporter (DMT)-like permease